MKTEAPKVLDRWLATRWEVRTGGYRLIVSRQWQSAQHSYGQRVRDRHLEVSWELRDLDSYASSIVTGEFESTGTLYDDLAQCEARALDALEQKARELRAIAERFKP